ncbi:alkaline phosphatase D family protein [Planctomicrobium piriforme]|uniref:Alkaline phosphatase D n=1 Tax=Planctomicrobium piriforme TaxID=1576369 RepID=A0A1I3NB37_9PLAN|nr:alkaline phosphatase D family protein [Planctomicrobium piriforme]SFJ06464.1 alkaline phosphatase D [Planctomicrobium piriforme]
MPSQNAGALRRRDFNRLVASSGLGALAGWPQRAPAQVTAETLRPRIECGVASGEISPTSAVLWSRADRPSRMQVEVATDDSFRNVVRRLNGGDALPHSDHTCQIQVDDLTPGEIFHYRIRFDSLEQPGALSEPMTGLLRTAPLKRQAVRFLWSGDTVGQGFGIDPARGGMRMYRTMLERKPDFFVHSGDTIYADNPLVESLTLDDGSVWRNIVTPEKSQVAQSLDEFRGCFRYNWLDEHFRAFHAAVPVLVQWDDHETLNNWYPGELLEDNRYSVKSASLLAARGRTAFLEYHPIKHRPGAKIYRTVPYGPDLELFFIDMRSYRGPNNANNQTALGTDAALLGPEQLRWLKQRLSESPATWKVICSDMPLGLICGDGPKAFENIANGNGPPLGRELELVDLLTHLREQNIRNTIWITADVHYAASHYYDPNKAQFQDFLPFWEFVSGPLHAGTFGPNPLDNTFGPQVVFKSIPDKLKPARPPSEGLQFFGQIDIDGQTGALTVGHYNVAGEKLWERTFEA